MGQQLILVCFVVTLERTFVSGLEDFEATPILLAPPLSEVLFNNFFVDDERQWVLRCVAAPTILILLMRVHRHRPIATTIPWRISCCLPLHSRLSFFATSSSQSYSSSFPLFGPSFPHFSPFCPPLFFHPSSPFPKEFLTDCQLSNFSQLTLVLEAEVHQFPILTFANRFLWFLRFLWLILTSLDLIDPGVDFNSWSSAKIVQENLNRATLANLVPPKLLCLMKVPFWGLDAVLQSCWDPGHCDDQGVVDRLDKRRYVGEERVLSHADAWDDHSPHQTGVQIRGQILVHFLEREGARRNGPRTGWFVVISFPTSQELAPSAFCHIELQKSSVC